MGNTPFTQNKEELFDHLLDKSPTYVDQAIRQLFDDADIDRNQALDKSEADIFFRELYTAMSKRKLDSTVKEWFQKYSKDGVITYGDFQVGIKDILKELNLAKQQSEYYGVLLVRKITLKNLPSSDTDVTDPVCSVSYSNQGKSTSRNTCSLTNDENPMWKTNIPFLVSPPYDSLHFVVKDKDILLDDEIGTFKVDVGKVVQRLETNFETEDHSQKSSEYGTIRITSPKMAEFAKKQNKKPTFSVDFEYQKWSIHYGADEGHEFMNHYNRMFFTVLKATFNKPATKAEQVARPTLKTKLQTRALSEIIYSIAIEDLTYPNMSKIAVAFTQVLNKLAYQMDKHPWASRAAGTAKMSEVLGRYLPDNVEGPWHGDSTSDELLTRVFFYGIGATRLTKQGEEFVVDFDPLKQYAVREGYIPFQGKLVFSSDGKPIHICYDGKTVKPGDPSWDFVKYMMRSAALTVVTAQEHLTVGHLIWSNLTNQASSGYLSSDHPIRLFLHIHLFRAAYVNANSVFVLVAQNGALDRCMSFTRPALIQVLDDCYKNYKFTPFPKFLENNGLLGVDPALFPMVQDGVDYYNIIHSYVKEYIDTFYDENRPPTKDTELVKFWKVYSESFPNGLPPLSVDSLIEVFSQFIFIVSAWHTHVGNVAPYSWDPAVAGTAVKEGQLLSLPQTMYLQNLITMGTAGEMPLMMHDWTHILPPEGKSAYNNFQKYLAEFVTVVEERNKNRQWVFNSFHPRHQKTSISV